MGLHPIVLLLLVLTFARVSRSQSETHHILQTWDNQTTEDGANITVILASTILYPSTEKQLMIMVEAPFYDDPHMEDGAPNETFPELWNFEVVEVFLLGDGDDEHYLEIELAPKGQYLLLELKGYRNLIRDKMPLYKMHFNTTIDSEANRWIGSAVIPNCYLPKNIVKFNAYAIHGSDPNRVYMSLFPTPEGQYEEADFHRLEHFGDLDFQKILPDNQIYSEIYHIVRTWDNKTTADEADIIVTLTSSTVSPSTERQLTILVDAPFYDDPHIGDDVPQESFWELWDYEVVEVFLLGRGSDQHYLEIELSPKGQYLLLELKGYRNQIRVEMPLYKMHYNTSINTTTGRWTGTAVIPNCYLPENIVKFNAYAIHGTDPDRVYMSLFPTTEGQFVDADFHRLDYFGDIEFQKLMPNLPYLPENRDETSGQNHLKVGLMGFILIHFLIHAFSNMVH